MTILLLMTTMMTILVMIIINNNNYNILNKDKINNENETILNKICSSYFYVCNEIYELMISMVVCFF